MKILVLFAFLLFSAYAQLDAERTIREMKQKEQEQVSNGKVKPRQLVTPDNEL